MYIGDVYIYEDFSDYSLREKLSMIWSVITGEEREFICEDYEADIDPSDRF